MDINKLIKQANSSDFDPNQKLFSAIAKDFVHEKPAAAPKKSKKKTKNKGKIARHKNRVNRGIKSGFGKSWGGEKVTFRVEFSWWEKATDEQSNEQTHWIEVKKFQGRHYQFYKQYFDQEEKWGNGETVESKFAYRYVANWLILNREEEELNQAFIFPSIDSRDDKIRDLLYRVIWTGNLPDYKEDESLKSVLKNNLWHERETIV